MNLTEYKFIKSYADEMINPITLTILLLTSLDIIEL